VRVQVRVRISTFDSGNSNRDEHMREVTHEQSHPYAEVKGTISGVTFPLRGPQETTLRGTVELNGKKQPRDVPVNLEPAADGVRARFSFPLSLDSFKVERPQLLFIKVDDRAVISGDLRFEAVR
jgi:YceI-like domain